MTGLDLEDLSGGVIGLFPAVDDEKENRRYTHRSCDSILVDLDSFPPAVAVSQIDSTSEPRGFSQIIKRSRFCGI